MKFKIPESTIKSFITTNFGEFKETSSGEIRINSPFEQDGKFHLYINSEKGVVHDFKTGYGSDFATFVADFLEIDRSRVIPLLIREYSNRQSLEEISISEYIEKSQDLILPKGLTWFSEAKKGIIRNRAYSYLKERNVSEKVINDLGYIFEPGSEYDRAIFIPFYEDGELVYFITRDFTKKNFLRYNNPKGLNSKKFVYNIDNIEDTVFIFEGVFDALMLEGQIGTAMLSADLGKEQAIKILDKAPKNVIFVPDNDETGENTLEKNIKLFIKYKATSLDINIMVLYLMGVKDFAETGKNHIDLRECVFWKKKDMTRFLEKMKH